MNSTVLAWLLLGASALTGALLWNAFGAARSDDRPDGADREPIAALAGALALGVVVLGLVALLLAELRLLTALTALIGVLAVGGAAVWRIGRRGRRGVAWRTGVAALWRQRGALVGLAAVLGFAVVAMRPGSDDLLGGRDPGVYVNIGAHIARAGRITVDDTALAAIPPARRCAFFSDSVCNNPTGTFEGRFVPGFYFPNSADGQIVPQFYHLFPTWLAVGHWLGGIGEDAPDAALGALAVPPAFGVLALVFAFLFLRRVTGTAIAVVSVLLLATLLPELWCLRNPMTEGSTQWSLFVALWATHRLLSGDDERVAAAGQRDLVLAVCALGATLLARIDALLIVSAFAAGVLVAGVSHVQAGRWRPSTLRAVMTRLVVGLLVFVAWSLAHGWWLSRPYVTALSDKLAPLAAASVGSLLLALVMVRVQRAQDAMGAALSALARVRLPLSLLATGALAAAVWWAWTVRPTLEPFEPFRGMARSYNEETLLRLGWYVGLPAIGATILGVGAALHAWLAELTQGGDGAPQQDPQPGRGPTVTAALPWFVVFIGFAALYLYKANIYPDHPWMTRRFIPAVLPGFMLLPGVFIAVLVERAGRDGLWRPLGVALLGLLALLAVAPADAALVGAHTVGKAADAQPWIASTFARLPRDVGLLVGIALAVLGALTAIGLIDPRGPAAPWGPRVVGVGVAALIATHVWAMSEPFWGFRERAGMVETIAGFAEQIPEDAVVLFGARGNSMVAATPLHFVHGKQIVPVTLEGVGPDKPTYEERERTFTRQVEAWLSGADGQPAREVYFLVRHPRELLFRSAKLRWELVHQAGLFFGSFGMHYEGPPRQPDERVHYAFRLYRATLASAAAGGVTCPPWRFDMGGAMFGTSRGFYAAERAGRGKIYRWADEHAALFVPRCEALAAEGTFELVVEASCMRPARHGPCPITVRVAGEAVGTLTPPGGYGFVRQAFAVPGRLLRGSSVENSFGGVEIRLAAAPWKPVDLGISTDSRELAFTLADVVLREAGSTAGDRDKRGRATGKKPPIINATRPRKGPMRIDIGGGDDRNEVRGFHFVERDGGRSFRWTAGNAVLVRHSHLPEGGVRTIRITLAANRPGGGPDVPVRWAVDGQRLPNFRVPSQGWITHTATIPGPLKDDGELRIQLTSPTFAPGGGRKLGLAVDKLVLE